MRTIKFRGKCVPDSKYAGEWVTGGLSQMSEGITPHDEDLIVRFLGGNCTRSYHVIPETVGQFTGLFDKNGTEIYEGDIIESGKDIRHLVRFCPEQGRFDCTLTRYVGDQDFDRTERCELSQRWIDEFGKTVIGNIHDNPELLKETTN